MAAGDAPSGTVTFLFTDIEGSTARWEADPVGMDRAVAVHDEVLRSVVEARGGWCFKHTGDGMQAAFGSPREAILAAVDAQRGLGLPVRMGIATGEVELRGGLYFGRVLNHTARVEDAGHGGQILVAASTAALVGDLGGVSLVELGSYRLRDLGAASRLFQVRAEGLRERFPALRTVDAVPGNLPVLATSFVGRSVEVGELVGLVRGHRLVTLTGVGGVGKTRLAVQVGAELTAEYGDGVWLVELASVGDPTAVPDAVAHVLGINPPAGTTVTVSVAEALVGRQLLLILDNCEHVLDAVADLVEVMLARSVSVTVVATSREGLRVGAEQLWPVPSLDVGEGADSEAVGLFVERARAVSPGFVLSNEADALAVTGICGRLDGIPLAIELAAARMVSMSAIDVRDRLGDRFRLLAGSRRGLERHQTLRHAVAWSYDLLNETEWALLNRCSVFADGFDLEAAAEICGGGQDEYAVLDVLDSLVRKSLITTEQVNGHLRYGMLETIRQFAEDQLASTPDIVAVRDRHARYFADQAVLRWREWDGPAQPELIAWGAVEWANLRAGFRWAVDQDDLTSAIAVAAHTVLPTGWALQRFEPATWAEELIDRAIAVDHPQLPRLYTAAATCFFSGRARDGIAYAETAVHLAADPKYDPFPTGLSGLMGGFANLFAGEIDQSVEIFGRLTEQTGLAQVIGRSGLLFALPLAGRTDEAVALAPVALDGARKWGNPTIVALALNGVGRLFGQIDPDRALEASREGLEYARQHRLHFFEAVIARDAAGVEALHGDPQQALNLFEIALDSLQRGGNIVNLRSTIGYLAVFFERFDQPAAAAILSGASAGFGVFMEATGLTEIIERVRGVLGDTEFDRLAATGSAMAPGDAVHYARQQIQAARLEFADRSG